MNNEIFGTQNRAPVADTRNNAGGLAYSLSDKATLAQYAVTGTFNSTYYTKAQQDFQRVSRLCNKVDNEFIAKLAIYARKHGVMKDTPAYLVAYLATQDYEKFHRVFDIVIDNHGMLRNFVKIMRSGAVGRKSLGSKARRACKRWYANRDAGKIFWQAFGNDPSAEDVIKLVHPAPKDAEQDALFGYLLGKKYNFEALPYQIQQFENFKKGATHEIPNVPWNRLVTLNLSDAQWTEVIVNMTWNQLRKNLNTALRHGVFNGASATHLICEKLRNPEAVKRSRALPFEIYTGIQALDAGVPQSVRNAMQDALELSLINAPKFEGGVAVLVDTSGSMGCTATGDRRSTTTCRDIAALSAAALLKSNPDNCTVVPYDTQVHTRNLNPRDSLATITCYITSLGGGGTATGMAMEYLNKKGITAKHVIIISDNESWADRSSLYKPYYGTRITAVADEWNKYRKRVRGSQLYCWDITPNNTTQAPSTKHTLNVGGFSSRVFDVVKAFTQYPSPEAWVEGINRIEI